MDWIFDHFQIVALIAIVIGSLVKRFFESKMEGRQPPAETFDPEEIFGPDDRWQQEETRPSVPPPLVRTVPPPLVVEVPHRHSREHESEVILKRQQDMQERLRQIKETKATTSGGAAVTSARISAARNPAKPLVPAKAGIINSLRNPREIRRAIVLREILGPPVSLR